MRFLLAAVAAGKDVYQEKPMSHTLEESKKMVEGVRKLIEAEAARSCAIRRVHAIRTMHLGPNDVLVAVRLDFDDGVTAARVEHIIADLERSIRQRYPDIRQLFLSPATTDQAEPR